MVDFTAHTARIISRIGQPVTITPAGQPERTVIAVFSSKPADAFGLVSGFTPVLRLGAADGSGVSAGDPVVINGTSYTVSALDDDSADSGEITLHLEAA